MPRVTSDLRIYLLGEYRIEYRGRPVKLPTRQTKLVLAFLALNGKPVRREKLATLFWGSRQIGEPALRDRHEDAELNEGSTEQHVRASLRTALSTIRRTLGNDILLDDNDTIQLNPSRVVWIDSEEFRRQAGEFLTESPPQAGRINLALYQGDFLAGIDDDPDAPWISPEREALRDLYRDVLLRMVQQSRSDGEYEIAIGYAEQVLAMETYNEEAYQHLMLCQFMLGHKNIALEYYRKLERALQDEFGQTEEGQPSLETKKLYHHIKRAKSRAVTVFVSLTNLPTPLTRFIARETETENIKRLLELPRMPEPSQVRTVPTRLVTLTGTGGCGKTRLAIEVATLLLGQYRDGVWWVELEALSRDDGQVAQAVAKVLGVREQTDRDLGDILVNYLRAKQMLLVLDNCEHLLSGCASLCERLLTACPQLQILTTSREMLRVTGERHFPVPSFTVPPAQVPVPVETMKQYQAVQFFLDRSVVEKPSFALNEENAASVAEICRRLDGIPLAIELAAARIKLGVDHIASHLNERFVLLTRGPRTLPRHQTLRAAIDWSYDLLNPLEQQLLNQLGVFASWFPLEAVEFVCGEGDEKVPVRVRLESLTDKSLVVLEMEPSGEARYRLLDSIREYAREKLQRSKDEADAGFARMGKYYLQFASQHQTEFVKLDQEWENVMAGLRVMHRQQMWEEVIQFGHAVTPTCFARGFYSEARRMYPWVCEAAERLEEQEAYVESMLNWGRAYIEQGFYTEAEEILTRLLRICREADDRGGIAGAQIHLAWIDVERSHYDLAEDRLQECQTIRERLGDRAGLAEIMLSRARMEYRFLRYDESERLALQALDILKPLPATPQAILALRRLALIARMKKDLVRAEQYCQEAISLCEKLEDRGELASSLYVLGQLRQSGGDLASARDSLEQSRALMKQIGDVKSEAYVLDFLGSVYADLKDYEPAYRAGQQSLDLLRNLGDDMGIIFASVRLGKTLCQLNRIQEACQLWAEALPTAEQLKHPRAEELKELLARHCSGIGPKDSAA